MHKLIALLCLSFSLSVSQLAYAHPGSGDHTHHQKASITQAEAQSKASAVVKKKVAQGKLSSRWLETTSSEAYKKSFGHGQEWVVEFHDPTATKKSRKTLYIFLGLNGKALGSNFTGN